MSLISIFAISACGFTPLYKKDSNNVEGCENFSVKSSGYEEVGIKLRYRLQDKLNEACLNADKNYLVNLNIDKTEEAIGIQKDREISRYNIGLVSSYTVTESESEKTFSGVSSLKGGYNAVASDYGTYAQQQDTFKKLAIETADDLALRIALQLKN